MPLRTAIVTKLDDLNRQDRRRARTRSRLLAAAKRLLATRGLHGTKIADIAAAADVGTGTFYLYFPTKDALFADLVRETALAAKDAMDVARAQHQDPVERARVGGATFFRFAAENRDVFKILFGHSAHFDALLREVHQIFIADIEQDFAAGVAAGAFRDLPPAFAAQAIVGMLTQVTSWWIDRQDVSIEEITSMTHRMLTQGTTVQGERA
ncbi:MAG: TetR family transcriptional regulator C-terminal domain-containing protein [Deltaproteobacteria bacterium]|nr:TetR family transcriptional regulator C-terminal domain-containing protein [Deltaproteobacteria bacterium]